VGSMESVIATMKPVMVHCARSCPMAKSRLNAVMATLKLDVDSTPATVPIPTTSSRSHLKRGPYWRDRLSNVAGRGNIFMSVFDFRVRKAPKPVSQRRDELVV